MKETKNRAGRDIIVVGFALFSMFFGAGNVIFPPYLGMESGPAWLAGFSAYFIADIGLALAAMFALLRVGSSEAVLQRVGRVPAEILMCAIILCVGPMVAIPRTSASTFEMAIAPNLPGVSAVVFSVLFFRTHPRAVHPRVRRGGHRGQGAHAAAAARPCGHHRQGASSRRSARSRPRRRSTAPS